jgi:hypothetical protein
VAEENFQYWLLALFLLLLTFSMFGEGLTRKADRKALFIVGSAFCVAIALLRPFGITPDDQFYQIHFERTCAISECKDIFFAAYDHGYFIALAIVKQAISSVDAMLIIAALALAIKLVVIGIGTNYSLRSLFFYFSLFFVYHDVTQFRVSASIAVFLLAIYLFSIKKGVLGFTALCLSPSFHLQAVAAPIVLVVKRMIGKKYVLWSIALIVIYVLPVLGLIPSELIVGFLGNFDEFRLQRNLALDPAEVRLRGTNLAILALCVYIALNMQRYNVVSSIHVISFSCVVVGFVFYFLFVGIPVIPVRLQQFFLVPLALLVSVGSRFGMFYFAVVAVGVVFFAINVWYAPFVGSQL